jgi:iron(III) transport system substrate-binding protein
MFAPIRPLLVVGLMLIVACGGAAPASPAAGQRPEQSAAMQRVTPPAEVQLARNNYDAPEWQALIAAARQEGKVVLGSSPTPATRLKLPSAFRERFGVELEYLGGRSSDLQTRLRGERAAGVYTVDVLIGGADSSVSMHREGWYTPIRPLLVVPEVQDPTAFRDNRLPFIDPDEQSMFELESSVAGAWLVNPQVVSESEIRTLDDLLNPKWKGKISAEDPTVPGQGQNAAVNIYLRKGEDFFTRLYLGQQVAISRDGRQLQDWLARESHPISLGLGARAADDMHDQGLPAQLVVTPDATGYVAGGFSIMAMLDPPPHPNAAKLFLNWMASPEGVALHAEAEDQLPMRKDVPHPWLRDYQVPKEGVDYVNLYDYGFIAGSKADVIRRIREIMGQ